MIYRCFSHRITADRPNSFAIFHDQRPLHPSPLRRWLINVRPDEQSGNLFARLYRRIGIPKSIPIPDTTMEITRQNDKAYNYRYSVQNTCSVSFMQYTATRRVLDVRRASYCVLLCPCLEYCSTVWSPVFNTIVKFLSTPLRHHSGNLLRFYRVNGI